MKTLTDPELAALAGDYFAPAGLYQYTKTLPFLGTLKCNTATLTAGQWTELVVEYTVGASGLADGAWIKGTFKFYSDWALFQTTNPRANNYISAEYVPGPLAPGQTAATVQSLSVRFDQKGHERPFQKAVIIDIVDGYMNPGDKIVVRLGDRRWGAKGTRVQTFVEDAFLMRWYIDPVGTSRFAPIKPDIAIPIVAGPPAKVRITTPRVVTPGLPLTIRFHTEDAWGNATMDRDGLKAHVSITRTGASSATETSVEEVVFPSQGWTIEKMTTTLSTAGDYLVTVSVLHESTIVTTTSEHVTADETFPVPRPLFADLHVHSDDTVGTNSTTYNFSYAQEIAGLDVIGYTANDFNVTAERWDATLAVIRQLNHDACGELVVFPGTEWCGNSAAGGDHNVVFLEDDTPEFPLDRHGNVARSFEWNEHGPADLVPGAWPLDEVYATYAHAAENHLLIPHVGGRRCNLAWHHPRLERLLEIGSAWGLFEWLLRDAVARGWKLGVCANSDEHRGRCGGGVPGTAVFGVRGGLTGVLAGSLERRAVADALRARRTFATTGEHRLVGLVTAHDGRVLQGDDVVVKAGGDITLDYRFYGATGFSSVEAWDASGRIFERNLQREVEAKSDPQRRILRVKWGGARLYDRYREAVWQGAILVSGATITNIRPFGGALESPEDVIRLASDTQVVFDTRTSGDFDGVDIFLDDHPLESVSVTGHLGGYVKVGHALSGNPHAPQPRFILDATAAELGEIGGRKIEIAGGVELFVTAETLLDVPLPPTVEGRFELKADSHLAGDHRAVYFVGREYSGGKVITSPIFIEYEG